MAPSEVNLGCRSTASDRDEELRWRTCARVESGVQTTIGTRMDEERLREASGQTVDWDSVSRRRDRGTIGWQDNEKDSEDPCGIETPGLKHRETRWATFEVRARTCIRMHSFGNRNHTRIGRKNLPRARVRIIVKFKDRTRE